MRDDIWIIDPDHRYQPGERANGPIIPSKMTEEDKIKYANVQPRLREPVYMLKDSDILRSLQRRGLRAV